MGILGVVKRKPTEKHTNWNLLAPVLSTECSAPEQVSSAAAPLGSTPAKKKPRAGSSLQCPTSGPHKKIDTTGISCCGKSKQDISLAVSLFLSIQLNFCVGFSSPTCLHMPAQSWWLDYITQTVLWSLPVAQLPQDTNFKAALLNILLHRQNKAVDKRGGLGSGRNCKQIFALHLRHTRKERRGSATGLPRVVI